MTTIKKPKSLTLSVVLIVLGLTSVAYYIDSRKLNKDAKEIEFTKEDIYIEKVLNNIASAGLEEAVPEVKSNRADVLYVANISCKLKSSNLSNEQVKNTVFSDPRAKAMNKEEKIVLGIIVDTALANYCN